MTSLVRFIARKVALLLRLFRSFSDHPSSFIGSFVMSVSLITRRNVLCGARINGISAVVPALTGARSFHAQPSGSARKRWHFKTLGGGLVAAGSGWYYLGSNNNAVRSFSVHSPLESNKDPSNDAERVTASSTLLRPASSAAPRRQTVALVFLTSQATSHGLVKSLVSNLPGSSGEREKWFPWIGYFREAGYDCLQMNLALPIDDADAADARSSAGADQTTLRLSDELHAQIRLSNLQRQPVLFVHHTADSSPSSTSQIVSSYIEPSKTSSGAGFWSKIFGAGAMFGSRPAISGLVVISDLDDASALTLFGKHPKLNTLIVANGGTSTKAHQGRVAILDAQGKKHDSVIKDIERWLISQGYEG